MPAEKLEIARGLSEAGVERIEAGFPRVSADDWEAVKLIAGAGLDAEIWGFSRAVRADVEALVELGVRASVVESPISELKLRALGVSREEMLKRIRAAVAYAVENDINVAYFGVDSTRAEPDFYDAAYAAAVEAGAAEVVVVDTIGVAGPEAVAELVGRTRELLGNEIPIHFHGHNDFGLATANAVAAVRAGRALDPRDASTGWASAPGTRTSARSRSRCARCTASRRRSTSRWRAFSPIGCASCPATRSSRGSRSSARTSSGARAARSRASSTTPRRSSRTRRSSSPPSAASCSARRAASTRSGSSPRSSGSTCRRRRSRQLLDAVKQLGIEKRGLVTDDEFRRLVAEAG